jgi:hypothetical protein
MLRFLTAAVLVSTAIAQDYYSAALDGAQEAPPVATAGRGWGIVRFDPASSSVRIFVYYEGTTGPGVASHLHVGPVGVSGPIIVPLSPASPNTYTGTGVLTAANAAALAANGTYLNVHTAAFPGGEVRGQVVPAASTRFTGLLTGAQETPPNASTATGTVIAFLHEPDGRVVYDINSTGLVNVTAAHMHQGPTGVAGPIVFGLNGGAGQYCGVSDRLTAAQITTMKANGMYMNIHTNAFAGGEIRAQLIKDLGDHWSARLNGAQEVPPVPTNGLGDVQMILSPSGLLTLTGAYSGLLGPTILAHIHLGAVGVAGPIVVPISFSGGTLSATFFPTAADLTNLRAGNWYVNVHSTVFSGGEIRGQLTPAKLPAPFGEGCLGSNGVRPQSGATGFASIGSPMSINLFGALPGGIELFAFGPSRDTASGVIPLPVELTTLGIASPNCFLLVDPQAILVVIADPFGCASQTLNVPFTPALRGLTFFSQWVSLDPLATPSGFVTSSALPLLIQ